MHTSSDKRMMLHNITVDFVTKLYKPIDVGSDKDVLHLVCIFKFCILVEGPDH